MFALNPDIECVRIFWGIHLLLAVVLVSDDDNMRYIELAIRRMSAAMFGVRASSGPEFIVCALCIILFLVFY